MSLCRLCRLCQLCQLCQLHCRRSPGLTPPDANRWTRDDAITAAVNLAVLCPIWAVGVTGYYIAAFGSADDEMDWFGEFTHPYARATLSKYATMREPGWFTPLALLCLELVREADVQKYPEGLVTGAWLGMCHMSQAQPIVGKAVYEGGILDEFQKIMGTWNPMERISKSNWVATAVLCAAKDVAQEAQNAGVEVIPGLLSAGAVDIAISSVQAYRMMGGTSEDTSALGIQWGCLFFLETLKLSSPQAKPVVAKLRDSGVDSFRYLLDHPLVCLRAIGMETGLQATRIAAVAWGRDDDGGGLAFTQQDIDRIVLAADQRGQAASIFPLEEDECRGILNLTVSDINKEMLLNADRLIPVLVDSLLLDPEHPRTSGTTIRGDFDFKAVAPLVQRVSRARPSIVARI